MKKGLVLVLVITLVTALLTGCGSTAATTPADEEGKTLIMAWYPNESGAELKEARDEIGKIINSVTGMVTVFSTSSDTFTTTNA